MIVTVSNTTRQHRLSMYRHPYKCAMARLTPPPQRLCTNRLKMSREGRKKTKLRNRPWKSLQFKIKTLSSSGKHHVSVLFPPSAPAHANGVACPGAEGRRAPRGEERRPQEPAGSADQPGERPSRPGFAWGISCLGA